MRSTWVARNTSTSRPKEWSLFPKEKTMRWTCSWQPSTLPSIRLVTLSNVIVFRFSRVGPSLTKWFYLRGPGAGGHGAGSWLQQDHLPREAPGRKLRGQSHEDCGSFCYHCGRGSQVRRVWEIRQTWSWVLISNLWNVAVFLRTGRPVRCCLERGDDMLITGGRHPFLGKYKVW